MRETVIAELRQVAARSPHAVAVSDEGVPYSYRDLLTDVDRLARGLSDAGVQPGDRVGLVTTRSYLGFAGMLAVLGAGAAYVPLDATYPVQRLRATVTTCAIRHIVGPGASLESFPSAGETTRIDSGFLTRAPVAGPPPPMPSADDIAYVLHTSGSSGPAKGVMVQHGALAAAVASLRTLFGLTTADRVLSFASLNWDTSGEELYPCLLAGATLVVDRRAFDGSVAALFTAIDDRQVTVVDLPTSFWAEVVDFLDTTGRTLPPSLRLVIVGGEEANATTVRTWCTRVPAHVALLNTYGQTETALVTHATHLRDSPGHAPRPFDRVPIGRPLPHVRQTLVPAGPGGGIAELFIGGPSVALGYQGRPAATAERFLPSSAGDGGRVFRTGDLVETGDDGALAYVGRADRQLKIRGFRVEPEEIERVLLAHPGLRSVAVHGAERPGGGRILTATVVPGAGSGVDEEAMAEWLRIRLPAHMVPTRFVIATALPLLPNRKTDYTMLEQAAEVPSLDATATEIAEIAGRVLDRPYDPSDDFFQSGGDSLTVTRLISRIYRRFDVELTYVDVFEQRTPRRLAALVVRRGGNGESRVSG
ncbi:non-ribosomal peptide synthetase [Streptomyces tsukubensis]|uniref:non-ribosomal peptide synthetase n=1 Tax=Streptomyces tsukubensis TaxID=83656 RepID=UPI00367450C9